MSQKKAACMLLSLIFFSYALVCILIYDLPAYRIGKESVSWESVEGIVTRSFVETETRVISDGKKSRNLYIYKPDIEYKYVVDDKSYRSTQLYGLSESIHSEQLSDAQDKVRRYKKGLQVKVFYNDSDPSVAVLEPGISQELETDLEFHVMVILLTAAILVWGIWGSCRG